MKTFDRTRLSFPNGIVLNFAIRDGNYQGFTASLDDRALLVAGRGNQPYFATPEGIHYFTFPVRAVREEGGRVILDLTAVGYCAPMMLDQDMYLFHRVSKYSGQVQDELRIVYEPRTVTVGGDAYAGFSIAYDFRSGTRKIHRFVESVALAPGGALNGARVMTQALRTNLCRLEEQVTVESSYSTEENYDGVTCIQAPNRGGGSLIFDLVQGSGLAVATYFEKPDALQSVIETQPGEDFITVTDQHYQALSSHFVTQPRLVVAATIPRTSTRAQDINRWTAWYDFTRVLWQTKARIAPTPTVPTLALEGTGAGGVDAGCTYPELLKVWAERMRWVKAQGFGGIILHTPEWVSPANQKTKWFGGNNCCPFAFRLSDHLGGDAGMRQFCEAAHAHGLKVYIWISGHFSAEAPIWNKHPDWAAHKPGRLVWDNPCRVVQSMSLVNGGREWMREDLRHVREATGVDGVWFDSFTSLSLQVMNYQLPGREPNAPAVIDFLGDLSELGYEIMLECSSQLGVSSFGLGPVDGVGQEELLYNSSLKTHHWLTPPAHEPAFEEHYFRTLAARAPLGVWIAEYNNRPRTPFPLALPAWFAPLTVAYGKVSARMHRRELLAQGEGALWYDATEGPAAFFAFNDGPVSLPATLVDLMTGKTLPAGRSQHVQARHIYAINP